MDVEICQNVYTIPNGENVHTRCRLWNSSFWGYNHSVDMISKTDNLFVTKSVKITWYGGGENKTFYKLLTIYRKQNWRFYFRLVI